MLGGGTLTHSWRQKPPSQRLALSPGRDTGAIPLSKASDRPGEWPMQRTKQPALSSPRLHLARQLETGAGRRKNSVTSVHPGPNKGPIIPQSFQVPALGAHQSPLGRGHTPMATGPGVWAAPVTGLEPWNSPCFQGPALSDGVSGTLLTNAPLFFHYRPLVC